MLLNYNTTIHLSAADCEEIIKNHLSKEHGFTATSITFDISTQLCGFGPSEHECSNFKGATVRSDK